MELLITHSGEGFDAFLMYAALPSASESDPHPGLFTYSYTDIIMLTVS